MTVKEKVRRDRQRAASALSLDQWDRRVDAMSLKEFCQRHSISLALFYVLEGKGLAPNTMRVGGRRLVSVEEAARWREQRQQPQAAVA